MSVAFKDGDFVLINYTLKVVEDGGETVWDTTQEDVAKKHNIFDPEKRYGELLVVIGKGRVIEGVEEALRDMNVGEKKEVEVPPEKAYGEYRSDLVIRVPIKQLRRHNIQPRVGQEIEIGGRIGRIKRLTERFAYIDFNHPLAGKKLKVEIEVVGKLENDEEKAAYLASRWIGVERSQVKVESANGTLRIVLPPDTLGVRDLESKLQLLSREVYEYITPRKLELVIEVEYPEQAEEKIEEAAERAGEAKEAKAEGS